MRKPIADDRFLHIKESLIHLCEDSGIVTAENIHDVFDDDLIESGILDSMGVVCLQEQIETRYNVTISQEQFIAELHTLNKLVTFLSANPAVEVAA